jgi:FAD/FMN-containing dehydrogenase
MLAGWGLIGEPGRERAGEDLPELTFGACLTRGLGRSYGDSSLPPSGETVPTSRLADRLLEFDPASGRLRAEAGVSLATLNRLFWPRGWTSPVLPGTQYVTLGGMVAADVHGKNHHVDGTIGRFVDRLTLRLSDDRIVGCSRQERPELFAATLGGMGLTGHILEVELRLTPIASPWILQQTDRVDGLDDLLSGLAEAAAKWPYTMAWCDALAGGKRLGRGIVYRGRWAGPDEAPAEPPPLSRRTVPFHFPGWALNGLSMRLFNEAIYRRHGDRSRREIVHPEKFFHPLDAIREWNRIYGRRGFTQHQSVLPEHDRPGAVRRLLEEVVRSGAASFLCVVKDCGDEGEGVLSFPAPGVSVAVDLPAGRRIQQVVDALNRVVIEEGGRVYLAKDRFSRREDFRSMEPRLDRFEEARQTWDPAGRLDSAQSRRLFGDRAVGEVAGPAEQLSLEVR